MKLVCDSINKQFALPDCGNDIAQQCLQALNDSVCVPQLINLSFKDIKLELQNRNVYFAAGDGEDLTVAVKAAGKSILSQVNIKSIHSIVMNLLGGVEMEFSEIEAAANELLKMFPEITINIGAKMNPAVKGYRKAYIVVSEIND